MCTGGSLGDIYIWFKDPSALCPPLYIYAYTCLLPGYPYLLPTWFCSFQSPDHGGEAFATIQESVYITPSQISFHKKCIILFHPAYYSHTCSLRAFSLTDIFQSPTSVAVEQHYSKTSHCPNTSQATQLLMTPEERRHCESLGVSSGPFHGHRPTTHPTVGCKLTKGWKWPQLAHRGHFQLCTHTCLSSVIQFLLGSGAAFYFCIFLLFFFKKL